MTSPLFKTAARLIVPLTLIFAAYVALKGHNAPGGGFIGGLMASVGFILYRMAHGRAAMLRLMPFHPRGLVALGLAIAYTTALVPLAFGKPLLTSLIINAFYIGFGQTVHFASAVFFDIGVLLVVVGVSVGMIQRLNEEVAAQEFDPHHDINTEGNAPDSNPASNPAPDLASASPTTTGDSA
ncbi:MAG: MnhB domain-containing protein [Algisphaera sp.]